MNFIDKYLNPAYQKEETPEVTYMKEVVTWPDKATVLMDYDTEDGTVDVPCAIYYEFEQHRDKVLVTKFEYRTFDIENVDVAFAVESVKAEIESHLVSKYGYRESVIKFDI